MARSLTVRDAHTIMNMLFHQATGQSAGSVVDTSSFVSAGEKVLATGMENVFNSINIVLGRLIVETRPYSAKLTLMEEMDNGAYTSRIRKVSFYSKDAKAAGNYNTDLFTNLKGGYTAGQNIDGEGVAHSTRSQWEQNPPVPLEMNFSSMNVWQNCITLYEDAIKQAFRNEEEFNRFVAGYMQEHANDIQQMREVWNRMNLLNKIGSVVDMSSVMNGSVINLTKAFNDEMDTSYTSEELRTTYIDDFLKWFVAFFKLESEHMTERTVNYHWSPQKVIDGESYSLLRHTPYANQRVYLFDELFTKAKARVLPEIFNPQYLDINTQYEPISYWQSIDNRSKIDVEPSVVNTVTGVEEKGARVTLDYVVGVICDDRALTTNIQLDRVDTTALEARKHFRNTWQSYARGAINDPTHNCLVMYMSDEA